MTVLYLFRSPGTGQSIEYLFDSIRDELAVHGLRTKAAYLPHISRGLRTVWQNLRFVKSLSADVFHITGDVHYAALALPASRTILTIHDCFLLEHNRHRPLRYAVFWLFWYYLPICRARIVTAVSATTKQELIRHVGRVAQKVQVIPNGYAPVFMQNDKPFCHRQPTLLQLGTAAHKNVSRLVRAIEGVACTLFLVGPLSADLVWELDQRKIRYRNYVDLSREEVVRLYVGCDIVTFVSTYEGFGLPILEANAVGRVVLTSDRSPMREVAANAAHLVDPVDTDAIRQGIGRLIRDDRYRQELIEKGLQNARRFTIAMAAQRYRKLYNNVCSVHLSTPSFL
ncbi:glycosyltransferase family 4 protein [Spirosoma fluviale]|uniref:Glycosyltransferase involved in cell wall bisynthesis n=1 Tax=Spirosoma fluviale TaxID=1597977 RepID=A0A286G3X1_9BACT|nr:glycosyltransferase family 1 protein [Spirosoma fluviale]SOD90188.1 Glycosyltransferase involved in cell wall bisynthesis [Spirosoma fluviale]